MADVTERTPAAIIRGATPLAPTAPAGVQVGDWVVMLLGLRAGTAAACPTPAGWAVITGSPWTTGGAVANTDTAVFGFARRWDGTWAMPSVAWSGDGGNNGNLLVRCFVGADPATLFDVAPVATSGAFASGSSQALTGLTTVTARAWVWHLFVPNSGVTALTVPDTADANNLNRPAMGSGSSGVQAAAGPTGTRTYSWTGGANATYVGLMLAIRPAPAPTVHSLAATLQGVATVPSDIKAVRGLAGLLQGVGLESADLATVAAGGRGPEDYETAVGPLTQVAAMSRRASMYITTADFPSTVIPPPGSTMKAGLYVGRGVSAPPNAQLPHQADGLTRTTRIDNWAAAGAAPPSPGNFPSGQPATLATEDGSPLFRSNGMPRVKVNLVGGQQSIPNDTVTPLVFTGEAADTDGMFDLATNPTDILVPFTGQWLVIFRVLFQPGNGAGYRQAVVQGAPADKSAWTNSTALINTAPVPGGQNSTVAMAQVIDRTGGTYIRLAVRHTDGAALNVTGTTNLTAIYLGPT